MHFPESHSSRSASVFLFGGRETRLERFCEGTTTKRTAWGERNTKQVCLWTNKTVFVRWKQHQRNNMNERCCCFHLTKTCNSDLLGGGCGEAVQKCVGLFCYEPTVSKSKPGFLLLHHSQQHEHFAFLILLITWIWKIFECLRVELEGKELSNADKDRFFVFYGFQLGYPMGSINNNCFFQY